MVQKSGTQNISIRMDSALKKEAEEFFGELGMSMSTAFTIFVRQSVREGRIPFELSVSAPARPLPARCQSASKEASAE